jgi:hypothetical protein
LPPAFGQQIINGALRDLVRRDLIGREHGLELADEVSRADDLLAERAQKLDRPRIHHRHVHDVVVG